MVLLRGQGKTVVDTSEGLHVQIQTTSTITLSRLNTYFNYYGFWDLTNNKDYQITYRYLC